MQKIKDFLKTPLGIQLYSFVKTYVTLFIGIYLSLQQVMSDDNLKVLAELNLIDVNILAISAKGAFISVLRNVYKVLTEK